MGGASRNRHRKDRKDYSKTHPRVAVVGAIARKGNVVAKVISEASASRLHAYVNEVVADEVSLVATDQNPGYKRIDFPHESVNHTRGEWVRGNIHTANLDSFWALLKRGVMGTYTRFPTSTCRSTSQSSRSGTTPGLAGHLRPSREGLSRGRRGIGRPPT
jgi:hypothetical protein